MEINKCYNKGVSHFCFPQKASCKTFTSTHIQTPYQVMFTHVISWKERRKNLRISKAGSFFSTAVFIQTQITQQTVASLPPSHQAQAVRSLILMLGKWY